MYPSVRNPSRGPSVKWESPGGRINTQGMIGELLLSLGPSGPFEIGTVGATGATGSAGPTGPSSVIQFPTVNALRANIITYPLVWLQSYSGNISDGAAGNFQLISSDTTSADNGGTIIVDAANHRYYRVFTGLVDARWFGVVADNVTLNTAPLQNAINASSGYCLFLPKGTMITGPLTLQSNSFIEGSSNTETILYLRNNGNDDLLFATGASGITLQNFQINGNQQHNTGPFNPDGYAGNCIRFVNSTGCFLQNLLLYNSADNAVTYWSCSNFLTSNCQAVNNFGNGFYPHSSTNLTFDACLAFNNGYGNFPDQEFEGFSADPGCANIKWNNCTAEQNNGFGFSSFGFNGGPNQYLLYSNCYAANNAFGGFGGTCNTNVLYDNCISNADGTQNLSVYSSGFAIIQQTGFPPSQYIQHNNCISINPGWNGFASYGVSGSLAENVTYRGCSVINASTGHAGIWLDYTNVALVTDVNIQSPSAQYAIDANSVNVTQLQIIGGSYQTGTIGVFNLQNDSSYLYNTGEGVVTANNFTITSNNLALGNSAGSTNQQNFSIALGYQAGQVSQGVGGGYAVAIGGGSGKTDQGAYSVAIGVGAGNVNQGSSCVAIGQEAGSIAQTTYGVSIGPYSGNQNQGEFSIAIGGNAGSFSQGFNSVALGFNAGYTGQGNYSIAIGNNAGQSQCAVGSIILNASNSALNSSNTGFFVNPVRSLGGATGPVMIYNSSTNEISYAASGKTFVIPHPLNQSQYLVHACLEGPEAGVYYRGEGKIDKGKDRVEIKLPPYTNILATRWTVQLTPIGNKPATSLLTASRVENGQFMVYGLPGDFFWTVYGCRVPIQTEVNIHESAVLGEGPYKYVISM